MAQKFVSVKLSRGYSSLPVAFEGTPDSGNCRLVILNNPVGFSIALAHDDCFHLEGGDCDGYAARIDFEKGDEKSLPGQLRELADYLENQ